MSVASACTYCVHLTSSLDDGPRKVEQGFMRCVCQLVWSKEHEHVGGVCMHLLRSLDEFTRRWVSQGRAGSMRCVL
jgi:hypothetical protein